MENIPAAPHTVFSNRNMVGLCISRVIVPKVHDIVGTGR